MSDPLYDKIIAGLDRLTDRERFEACAGDLLRKIYPRLVPIPGGDDAGFDGAAVQENGDSIQLVCTTGENVIGNLTGSLTEAKKKGRKSNTVLLATSRKLSPRQKRNLEERATAFGKALLAVYDQQPFADLLYHDSRWRKDLLNLPGNPPALSRLPVSHRPTFELPMLGREVEQKAVIAASVDLVVMGQPGSGKTHLLTQLAQQTNGLFVVTADRTAIAEGLRDQHPGWIIVDDASTRLDVLLDLRQLRNDITKDFRIVATCWPGQQNEVADKLGVTGLPPVELLPLPVKIIREIVAAMRIVGPDDLVREILHQSAGKPGLAVTLCQLCWRHGTKELFTGEALTRDVTQSLTALAGEDSVRLLAYFALAGNVGLTIEVAAQMTAFPHPVVARLTERMGAAGVLEVRRERRLSVEPVRLRQALVRDVFCKAPAALDWRGPVGRMPDRADAVETLIAAGLLGGELDDAALRQEIDGLRTSYRIGEICEHYAWLGSAQSRWVLAEFPGFAGKAADALLAHIPEETIPVLLRASLTQNRIVRQSRDELPELCKWIEERANGPSSIPRRAQLLGALEKLRADLRDTPTLLAGIRHVLANQFEWTDQPPGEASTFRVRHGFVPADALEQIAAFWPRAFRLLTGLSVSNALKIRDVIGDWANPRAWGEGQLTPKFAEACKRHARTMLADLARAYAGSWAILHSFHSMAQQAGFEMPSVSGLPAILFPSHTMGFDDELSRAQHAAVERLASEWVSRGPDGTLIDEWLRTDREATVAGVSYSNLSREVATLIARGSACANEWLDALVQREAPAQLVRPFVDRCCGLSAEWPREFSGRYLEHANYGVLAVDCLLRFVPVSEGIWSSARLAIGKNAKSVGHWVLLNAVPDSTILELLTEFGPEVAGEVAAHLWSAGPKGVIPEDLQPAWRRAVVEHLEDVYQIEEISTAHSDLACSWLKRRLNQTWQDQVGGAHAYDFYHYLPGVIAALSSTQRREVIDHFDANNFHENVLAHLIGGDLELFRHSLTRPETARLAIGCLGEPGDPVDPWVQRATMLMDAGYTEERLMMASAFNGGSWTGPTSRYYQEKLQQFQPFSRQSDLRIRRIGEAAIAHLTRLRDEAFQHERVAAVKGELA